MRYQAYCQSNLGNDTLASSYPILESCEGITKEERERIIASLGKDLFEPSSFRFDPDLTRSLLTLLFIAAEIPGNKYPVLGTGYEIQTRI